MQKAPGMRSESTLSTEVGLTRKFLFSRTRILVSRNEILAEILAKIVTKIKNDGFYGDTLYFILYPLLEHQRQTYPDRDMSC
jgi:hypothetical protein